MKKFVVFVTALFLLIASEYYFLNEIFARRRLPVIAVSLGLTVLSVYFFLRFFKSAVSASPQ